MRLRLGQVVCSTDGRFGTLGDIVVDPYRRTVTHIVVYPDQRHYQARLVPTWLLQEEGDVVVVQLDTAHLRRLERSSSTDFVPVDEPVELDASWDVDNEELVSVPYLDAEFDLGWRDERVGVPYKRMPKGEVEIRRTSEVVTSDGHTVGRVDGLLADDEHITAVVARVGVPGFRHRVLIPLSAVGVVLNDRVKLTITRQQVHLLPSTDFEDDSGDLRRHIDDLTQRADELRETFADTTRSIVANLRSRRR